ncbi:MAG: rhomboid family intramembrane serine protease [candidate division Zixibacteria bacterium]|nr:rhomboid family intramembrane serine protease [candidate division Zixibacteria bacterium]
MFPLKDDNPISRLPIITIVLIVINCLAHFYRMTLPAQEAQLLVFRFGLIPAEVSHLTDMTPKIPFPVWLSPFTSMFLHGDLWHLGGNMLYLWIFGNNVEDHLGPIRFLIFYLVSGLAAVALFVLLKPNGTVPMIGASGAIAGVLGAYFVLFPRARILTLIWIIFIIRLVWLPAIFILGYWFIIQLVMGVSSLSSQGGGVAWFAHVGGFAFGWLFFKLRTTFRRQSAAV